MTDEGLEPYGAVAGQAAGARYRPGLIGAAAVVLAAGIGGGFAAGWASRGAPPAATSVISPGAGGQPSQVGGFSSASATTVAGRLGGVVSDGGATVWASPVGVGTNQKATQIARRTTADGIAVRAYRTSFGGAGATTSSCVPTGFVMVELSDTAAVLQSNVPVYSDSSQKLTVLATGLWGLAEGSPAAWAVIATGPGFDRVSVTFDGGTTDVATPVNGVAVVATELASAPTGGPAGTVVATGPGGARTTVPITATAMSGPMRPACFSSPGPAIPATVPSLPPAGAQPADPLAARAAVTRAIGIVFGGVAATDPFAYVQGATDAVRAAQKTAQDNNPGHHTSTIIQDIVFTSPTTGAARYQLLDNGNPVLTPVSQVVLDAGVWKVTAASACAAYALGGGHC